jgi:4-hydroxythreonine-4-phosphate dehydrogenase
VSGALKRRPIVAVTLGDVAGIGPEVSVRAVCDPRVRGLCRPVIVGDPTIVERAVQQAGISLTVKAVEGPTPEEGFDSIACWSPRSVTPIAVGQPVAVSDDLVDVPVGEIDARAGRAAYVWLVAATQAALGGEVGAVVTAPLHKVALKAAGHDFPGHTEILAEECGVREFAMMLYVPPGGRVGGSHGLGVAHVTLHTALSTVPTGISTQNVHETMLLIDGFLRRVGCVWPRVGVCALNPHAGEGGRFGNEESMWIAPAVEKAREAGMAVSGPMAADALMRRAVAGEFDGVVAMYHDQGHIALKLVAFNQAVNVTLGLPIVRTSPSHGTAFDIAGRGLADPEGMAAAIQTAVRLADR